jgi:hypothetical protein
MGTPVIARRALLGAAPIVPFLMSQARANGCTAQIVVNEAQFATVLVNDPIRILVANNFPGTPTDWVSISLGESPDDQFLSWAFLNGTQTAPAMARQYANFTMIAPATQWVYEVKLFYQGSFSVLARTAFIARTV